MKCPTCDESTRVLETRQSARRRVCSKGHVFWTAEVVTTDVTQANKRSTLAAERRRTVLSSPKEKSAVLAHTLGIAESTVSMIRQRAKEKQHGT